MTKLGCFHKVNAVIDVSAEGDKELEVRFNVEELPLTYVDGALETGDNEVIAVARAGIPNYTGKGERLETRLKLGTNGTQHVSLDYKMPIRHSLLLKMSGGTLCNSSFIASLYRKTHLLTWSSLKANLNGLCLSARLSPLPWITQVVSWDCSWRQLLPLDHPGFVSRSMCGHSLKSSLINTLTINTLDTLSTPSNGINVKLDQELAGLGIGNVAYFKTELSGGFYKQIANNLVIGTTFAGGNISHMIPSDDACNVRTGLACDKFTLGGPILMRGFRNHRLGDVEDGDYLGVNAFWRVAVHALTKRLPFSRGDSWIANNVRAHIFAETCQAGNPTGGSYLKWLFENATARPRASLGLGLLVRLGEFGRAELNYSIPVSSKIGDSLSNGLQFGIGVVFS